MPTDADESVFEEVFVDMDYKLLDDVIKGAKNCILDIGAHIGCFSVYSSFLNPDVGIFAFEPELSNFALLKEHLKNNGAKNVKAKNLAVWSGDGAGKLFISEDSHNHSLVKNGGVGEINVNFISLQRALFTFNKCDLVKMDCEGAEFEIFRNTPLDVLKKVSVFYIEYHLYDDGFDKNELVSILQRAGFKTRMTPSFYSTEMGFILAKQA